MPKDLPTFLYTAEQVRALDQCAIETHGIAGFTLMKRAGKATLRHIRESWPARRRLIVLCGNGNNAGDGFIIAGAAMVAGLRVVLVQVGGAERFSPAATRARDWAHKRGVRPVSALPKRCTADDDVIVDALLGIGLSGALRPEYRAAVDWINSSGLPVCAVDIPSGLCADTGSELGLAVRADLTVTFIGLKQGLFTGAGPACSGRIRLDNLGVPDRVYAGQVPAARRIVAADVHPWLRPRARDAHKGHFGHVLIIGGERGMGGAVALAAEAALRTGAGLVSVATRGVNVAGVLARRPECMVQAVETGQDLRPLLERCTVLVIGPGLGRGAWATQMMQQAGSVTVPRVVDADALNLLADAPAQLPLPGPAILTPHPGEAARLLGCDAATVQADRFAAIRRLQQLAGASVVLKGSGTLVAAAHPDLAAPAISICDRGNPGMASGGMGDTLSGMLGALLAQGIPIADAARAGVWLHASAADLAARARGERGLVAADLFEPLGKLLNP